MLINYINSQDAKGSSSRNEHKAQQQQQQQDKPGSSDPSENNKFRLLGDLPSLGGGGERAKNNSGAAVALSLALHSNETNPASNFMRGRV